jgi:hypothetical protein
MSEAVTKYFTRLLAGKLKDSPNVGTLLNITDLLWDGP